MTFRKLLPLFLLVFSTAGFCGADPIFKPVLFLSSEKAGVAEVKAQFYVDADAATAWAVLSDYEHIPQFVSSMKKSHVEKTENGDILLTQEAEAGFLFITKRVHVLLKVHEVPGQSIYFQDVSQKDFSFYEGSWNIEPRAEGGVSVVYQLKAKKNFDAPFAGDYLNGGVKDLLVAVQKQIYACQMIVKKNQGLASVNPAQVNPATTPHPTEN
jgi:ribosome-associated toxin RatA of RatAB toxin-antitoxin module